jgi:hypothetical protein
VTLREPRTCAPFNNDVRLELSAYHVGASVSGDRAIPHALRYAAIKTPSGFKRALAVRKKAIRSGLAVR